MKTVISNILNYFEYLSKARLAGYYVRRGEYDKAKQLMQE